MKLGKVVAGGLAGAAMLAIGGMTGTAEAAVCATGTVTYNKGGGGSTVVNLTTDDVSLTIGSTIYKPADCAILTPGNQAQGDKAQQTAAFNAEFAPGGFVYLDASDSAPGAGLGGINFLITATNQNTGTWTVTWTEAPGLPNLPITMDFSVILKGGNDELAAYLLKGVFLPISPNSGTGTFSLLIPNNANNLGRLSHMTLVGKVAETPPPPPTPVPEPASLALLGMGLLGLGAIARRRRT